MTPNDQTMTFRNFHRMSLQQKTLVYFAVLLKSHILLNRDIFHVTGTADTVFSLKTEFNPLSAYQKMVKHTQKIRWKFADEFFECV